MASPPEITENRGQHATVSGLVPELVAPVTIVSKAAWNYKAARWRQNAARFALQRSLKTSLKSRVPSR